ncbi:MAG TPA: dihydrofolate reductase [Dermatophilaceae bacterium]|nr:dihydrofolate reductase [Dermatophilaceae bacterium]
MTRSSSRPRVTVVAALGRNRVIGSDGRLPWHLPADLAHFKDLTMGHTIVMGRRTWDAIGRALPGRTTIVLTRRRDWSAPGALVAHSLSAALDQVDGPEAFVVGGGEIYRQAMPVADRLVLTEVDAAPEGDTYFPSFDRAEFVEVSREPHQGFAVVTYERT